MILRFPVRQVDKVLELLRLRKPVPIAVVGRSFLWDPPPEYYIKEKWDEAHSKLNQEAKTRYLEQKETKNGENPTPKLGGPSTTTGTPSSTQSTE